METTNKRPEWLTISFTDHFCHHLNTLAATHLVHLQHNFLQNRSSKYIYCYTTDIRDRSQLVVLSGSWFWKQSSVPISKKLKFNRAFNVIVETVFIYFVKPLGGPRFPKTFWEAQSGLRLDQHKWTLEFSQTFGAWSSLGPPNQQKMNSQRFPKTFGAWSIWRHRSTANELSRFPKTFGTGPVEDTDQQQVSSLSRLPKTFGAQSTWRHRSTASELTLKTSQNIWSPVHLKTQINSKWAHSQDFPKNLEPSPLEDTDQLQMNSLSRFPKKFGARSSWRHRSTASELTLKISQNIWSLVQLKTQINSKWTHSQDFPKHLEPGPVEDTDQQQMNSLSRFPRTLEAQCSWRHRSTANELTLKISQNIWSPVQLKTQINSKLHSNCTTNSLGIRLE